MFVEGFAYAGDLIKSITAALKRGGAYVNRSLVEEQMAMGRLLIIFDGHSEIREEFRNDPKVDDLANVVSNVPDVAFVFTSRAPLTPFLAPALGVCATAKLLPLEESTIQLILDKYLKRKESSPILIERMKLIRASLPTTPLMLRLLASYYNKNGEAPQTRVALYDDYVREPLRPEATGLAEALPLHYAAEQIVGGTHLAKGGQRGFFEFEGIKILIGVADTLDKGYGLKRPAMELLRLLERAGLPRSNDKDWKFVHDTFESYYAARVLEQEVRSDDRTYIVLATSKPGLADAFEFLKERLNAADREKLTQWLTPDSGDETTQSAS